MQTGNSGYPANRMSHYKIGYNTFIMAGNNIVK